MAQSSATTTNTVTSNDHLIQSNDVSHPANLLPALCAKFWPLGWMPGTGGGVSIRQGDLVYVAPSAVQKELMQSTDLYVLSLAAHRLGAPESDLILRSPPRGRPSQCTPLFLAAFSRRGAGCCIHTHSVWAVLVTLLVAPAPALLGADLPRTSAAVFEINHLEQIKGIPRGGDGGYLGFHDTLRVPVIENTPQERDLTPYLEATLDAFPDTCAVLVRRHGLYVWGEDVAKAKTQCESLDYIFQLAVEMRKLALPWVSDDVPRVF